MSNAMAWCLTGVLVLASAGAAQAAVDNFDDNSLDLVLWTYTTEGNGALTETNMRVEYTSPGSVIDENGADIELGIPCPFDEPWTVTLDVHVGDYGIPNPTTYEYGIDLAITNAADDTDLVSVGRARGDDGAGSGFDNNWGVYKATNDVDEIDEFTAASGSDGTIKVVWDGTELDILVDEGGGFVPLKTGISVAGWGMSSGSAFSLVLGGADTSAFTALLRDQFVGADVGIIGANFLVADTGSTVLVTNEGNGDLTASLPDVHIVTASIDKVIPS